MPEISIQTFSVKSFPFIFRLRFPAQGILTELTAMGQRNLGKTGMFEKDFPLSCSMGE